MKTSAKWWFNSLTHEIMGEMVDNGGFTPWNIGIKGGWIQKDRQKKWEPLWLNQSFSGISWDLMITMVLEYNVVPR